MDRPCSKRERGIKPNAAKKENVSEKRIRVRNGREESSITITMAKRVTARSEAKTYIFISAKLGHVEEGKL